jgi:hypothetical protein
MHHGGTAWGASKSYPCPEKGFVILTLLPTTQSSLSHFSAGVFLTKQSAFFVASSSGGSLFNDGVTHALAMRMFRLNPNADA